MIIINNIFHCFRGTPTRLASADHAKPHHVRCAVVRSVHYKRMQKKENETEFPRFISKSLSCLFSNSLIAGNPVGIFTLTSAAGVLVTPPHWGTPESDQHQGKGRGSLPRSSNLLLTIGDSNDLMPILWVGVNGDSNILMPMLRDGDASTINFVFSYPIVTYSPIPVDLSGDNVVNLGHALARYDLCLPELDALCRLLGTWCPGHGHNSEPAAPGITDSDLTVAAPTVLMSGFIHC